MFMKQLEHLYYSNRMKELNQNIEDTEDRITFEINNVKATAMKMQPKVLVQREF